MTEILTIDWMQRLTILALAMIIDAVVGDPDVIWKKVPHPVAGLGMLIAALDRRFNRGGAADNRRFIAGLGVTLTVVLVASSFGCAIAWLKIRYDWGVGIEIALVAILLAQKSLFLHVWAVRESLRRLESAQNQGETDATKLATTRREVSKIVGRDVDALDRYGMARAAVESLAENFADGVVAPVLFYLAFGLPGLCFYKALNTLDSMIGHHNLRYEWFGKVAARLDDAANFIPARLAALFLAMAAWFTPQASWRRAVAAVWRDARHHRSVNAGWPEAALAGALDFALAGPRRYHNILVKDRWMGQGRARLGWRDIDRALFLYSLACLVQFLAVILGLVSLA
ncbi:MAG: adenosylcobinamide-phosphate synthase CbiB [Candidatus Symbiobacter sp.]|nr:adenosylcobinamide-phosphate synthase CbiB [Candidatus Symbiobacter sp.]